MTEAADAAREAALAESIVASPESQPPGAVAAALRVLAEHDAGDRFEVEHLGLLEAVVDWDYDAALTMRPEPGAWARLAYEVRAARQALARAEEAIARELASILAYSQTQVFEGAPPFILRGGNTRKAWDHDGIRAKALVAIADRLSLSVRDVEAVVGAWLDLASPSWKVTGLKAIGLDPDEFCEKTRGAPTIQFED